MTNSTAAAGLTVQQWDDRFFTEYLQANRFKPEMGTSPTSVIQVKEDLTKKPGDKITFALVNRLTNSATTGANTMEGNEEDMASRSHRITVDKRRNAVRFAEIEAQKSAISLRNAAKAVLKDWAMEDTRDLIIEALGSIAGKTYFSASDAEKDTWTVRNQDRVLFGNALANYDPDHNLALANVDNTMTFGANDLALMKRMALSADPKIRPVRDEKNGRRYFVCYTGPLTFRDLKQDSDILQAQSQVSLTEENSRLFKGGDLVWDGIIIKEVDDIGLISSVGAGSIDVAPVYLCGAQAVGMGFAKRWTSRTEEFDYGDKYGCETHAIYGVEKLRFGTGANDDDTPKDHGVVTGFFAASGDV